MAVLWHNLKCSSLSSVVLSVFKSGYFIKFGVEIFPHDYPTGFQKQNLLPFFPSCFVLSWVIKLHGQGVWLITVTGLISVSSGRVVVVAHAFNPSTWEAEASGPL